uniref:Solute carrier family 49 member 3 n=1 Tax=Varanus komodoensis TaxID=61221 RepID=A0A8D2ISP9_VARKO
TTMDMVNWLSIVYLVISVPVGFLAVWILDTVGLKCALGVYAGPAAFACVLATFGVHQKVPPTPPSASAFQSDSLSFSGGLKMLLRNKAYLILAASLGSGIALVTCYSALLEQILCVNGYSDSFAGMCGAFFTVFGLIGAFFLGLYVDRTKKFTEVTKICFCLTALASTPFLLQMSHYRNQTYAVATFSALFGLFGFALYPVAMELAVECSYPVGEGTSSGLIFPLAASASRLELSNCFLARLKRHPVEGTLCREGIMVLDAVKDVQLSVSQDRRAFSSLSCLAQV